MVAGLDRLGLLLPLWPEARWDGESNDYESWGGTILETRERLLKDLLAMAARGGRVE